MIVATPSDSVLKMLSANAAQPIFSARNEAIGWEEVYDILRSQYQYSCCDSPPELEKFFYSQLRKPAKEVSL